MIKTLAVIVILIASITAAFAQLGKQGPFPFNPGLIGPLCPGFGALCQPLPTGATPCGAGALDFTDACGTTFLTVGTP